jgi:hypothetical protein
MLRGVHPVKKILFDRPEIVTDPRTLLADPSDWQCRLGPRIAGYEAYISLGGNET